MQRVLCWLTVLSASCYAEIEGLPPDPVDPLPRRTFYEACEGAGVALDADHFVVLSSLEASARIYSRTGDPRPVATLDTPLGIADAARVGSRIYAIGNTQLTAIDVDTLAVTATSTIVSALATPAAWLSPAPDVIAAIDPATIQIEGLAFAPRTEYPARMWIGLAAPLIDGKAIAVALVDPAAAHAQFVEAALLDLGGLGIRGMTWSDALGEIVFVAGPVDTDRYRLFRWSGTAGEPPLPITDLTAPHGAVAETIIAYPQSADVQVVFDMRDAMVVDAPCRQVSTPERSFQDVVVPVD